MLAAPGEVCHHRSKILVTLLQQSERYILTFHYTTTPYTHRLARGSRVSIYISWIVSQDYFLKSDWNWDSSVCFSFRDQLLMHVCWILSLFVGGCSYSESWCMVTRDRRSQTTFQRYSCMCLCPICASVMAITYRESIDHQFACLAMHHDLLSRFCHLIFQFGNSHFDLLADSTLESTLEFCTTSLWSRSEVIPDAP